MSVIGRIGKRAWAVVMMLGMMLSPHLLADDSIDRHLARAEAVKRSQLSAFIAELEAVEAELPLLSARQRDHLAYLRTWQQTHAGNFDAAIAGFETLIANSSDQLLRFRSRVTLVNALTLAKRYPESYEQLILILAELESIEDADARSQALGATAQLLIQVARYEESLHYSTRLLDESESPWARCGAAQLRYEALVKSAKLADVNADLLRQADECAVHDEHVFAGLIRTYIARLQMQNGRDGEAIAGLLRHQPAIRNTRYLPLIADVAAVLAKAYKAQGNYQQALAAAQEAIDTTKAGSSTESLADAWRVIYEIASRQGDNVRALHALEQHQKVERAWLDDVGQRAIAFEMARQQSRARALEIEGLEQQNHLLQLQQQISAQSVRSSRLSVLLLISILGFVILWTLRARRMNRRLRKIAQTDALTGVASRAHFMETAQSTLTRLQREGAPAAVVLMDLDQFKNINDCYGHSVGDDVLARAVDACRRALDAQDLMGRLGGEEFAILLPRKDSNAATAFAERCRIALQTIRFGPESESNLLSASFGIANSNESGHGLERLLADSDAAMYDAKRQGRNRVVTHVSTELVH